MQSLWQQVFGIDWGGPRGRRTRSEATTAGPKGLAVWRVQEQLQETLGTSPFCPQHLLWHTDHSLNSGNTSGQHNPSWQPWPHVPPEPLFLSAPRSDWNTVRARSREEIVICIWTWNSTFWSCEPDPAGASWACSQSQPACFNLGLEDWGGTPCASFPAGRHSYTHKHTRKCNRPAVLASLAEERLPRGKERKEGKGLCKCILLKPQGSSSFWMFDRAIGTHQERPAGPGAISQCWTLTVH